MSRLVYVIYVFRYDTATAAATLEDSYTGLPLSSWSAVVVVVLGKSRHATLLYIFWLAERPYLVDSTVDYEDYYYTLSQKLLYPH